MTPAAGARSRTVTTLVALTALLLGTLVVVLSGHAPADGAEPGPERRYAPGIDPTLPADATVRGTVLGPDGKLRDNIVVEAFSAVDPTGDPVASDLTYEVGDIASHGAYTLHVPAGDYLVRFSSPDDATTTLEPTFYGGGAGTPVTVAGGQDLLLDPVHMRRDQGAPVTGRVVDADGQPLPYVEVDLVELRSAGRYSVWDTVGTAEDGTFRFDAVNRGEELTLRVEGAPVDPFEDGGGRPTTWLGDSPSQLGATTFAVGRRAVLHDVGDLVQRPGVAVTGRATTVDGPLGAGADVALIHFGATGATGAVVAWFWSGTVEDGYAFAALPGRYTVGVLRYDDNGNRHWVFLGDTPDLTKAQRFTVTEDPYDAGTLTIGTRTSLVTFSVVERDGRPSTWDRSPALLDRDGDVLAWATDLGDGRFRVRASWDAEFTVGAYDGDSGEWMYLGGTTSVTRARFLTASPTTPTIDAGVVSMGLAPPTAPAPRLQGKARNGQVLAVSAPTWSLPEVTTSYQWLRDGVPVGGATSTSYLLGTRDVGHRVSVRATGTSERHQDGAVTSASLLVGQGEAPTTVRPPTISGRAAPGGVLVAAPAAWDTDGVSTSLQWYADGRRISGATGTSLRLGHQHAGAAITVVATATLPGFAPGSSTSRPVRVARAQPQLRLTAGSSSVTLRLTVPGGLPATGRVVLYRGSKVVARTVLTARQRGATTVDLSRLGRGKHRISARFEGNDAVLPGRSRPVTVRVGR